MIDDDSEDYLIAKLMHSKPKGQRMTFIGLAAFMRVRRKYSRIIMMLSWSIMIWVKGRVKRLFVRQIRELLQNLIGIAIKYHKPGVPPLVRVSAQADPDKLGDAALVIIQAEDNGIGFEETQKGARR